MREIKIHKLVVVFFSIIIFNSCSNDSSKTKQSSNYYRYSAESNTRQAEDYRNRGIEYMAEYHEKEAEKARHNEIAQDCGMLDFIIFDILLSGDSCDRKN